MSNTYHRNFEHNDTELTFKTSYGEDLIENEINIINISSNNNDNNDNDNDNIKNIDNNNENINNGKKVVDEIGKLYRRVTISEKVAECLFYINLIVSAITIIEFKLQNLFFKINIISSITYIFLINLTDMWFKNVAENERRKGFIKDSYNINITRKKTEGYYNNNEEKSVRKMV